MRKLLTSSAYVTKHSLGALLLADSEHDPLLCLALRLSVTAIQKYKHVETHVLKPCVPHHTAFELPLAFERKP